MRRFFHVFFVLTVLAVPFAIGCDSKQDQAAPPAEASDEGDAAVPVNDADNP